MVAAITPWNFPIAMITRKAGPALAAGCTVRDQARRARRRSRRWRWPSWPSGPACRRACFNVITGLGGEIGGRAHLQPDGAQAHLHRLDRGRRSCSRKCAPTVKKVSLELGGNAPFIVFDDADLDAAVRGRDGVASTATPARPASAPTASWCRTASTTRSPRSWPTPSRSSKVGNGLEAGVTQGPLIDEAAVEKVEEHIADAVAKGARVVAGGKRHALGGTFFEPTVLADVPPAA